MAHDTSYEVITNKEILEHDHLFKLLIIGDTGVGKSCLLLRAMNEPFLSQHNVTIGVEFGVFVIKYQGKIIKLQIWDTAGQEAFRSITRIFYRDAQCVFFTYDITREETFENISGWLKEVRQNAQQNALMYLVANQIDEDYHRSVDRDRGESFSYENGFMGYFETSAKTGEGVEKVFREYNVLAVC